MEYKAGLKVGGTGMAAMRLATAAHARSSVTIYGVLDAGLPYQSKSRVQATGASAGSYIGFGDSRYTPSQFGSRGVENRGGRLKAEFEPESGINAGTGEYPMSTSALFLPAGTTTAVDLGIRHTI